MEIRDARADDVEAVVDLWDREGGPTTLASGAAEVHQLLERDPRALVLAVTGEEIVGTLVVGWDGWRCHLYRLVVAPSWRRRGLATALLAEATQRAERMGARRFDAIVGVDNAPAIAFWDRHRFEQHTESGRWSLRLPGSHHADSSHAGPSALRRSV